MFGLSYHSMLIQSLNPHQHCFHSVNMQYMIRDSLCSSTVSFKLQLTFADILDMNSLETSAATTPTLCYKCCEEGNVACGFTKNDKVVISIKILVCNYVIVAV